jgi:hypothetical protein
VDDGTGTSSSGGRGPIYDVGADTEDSAGIDCQCGSQLGFSYIWIANSGESTVSKVNTMTMVEEGRYRTRIDGAGNPSRTSVSLSGRRAAVANRSGGVAAFWALPELCDEAVNGAPGVQTSTGKDDVLAFGMDDCLAWTAEFPGYTTQRPIAWMPGTLDRDSCEYEGERLWTSGCNQAVDANIWAHRVDGDTGVVLDTVEVAGFVCDNYGGYGGAVDKDGNFWIGNQTGGAKLARVDGGTLQSTIYPAPVNPYGITVDHLGRPWLTSDSTQNSGLVPGLIGAASTAVFDPATETWALAQSHLAWGQSGLQEDGEGRMWVTYYAYDGDWQGSQGITWIDVETLEVGPPIDLEAQGLADGLAKGISIDLHGNVWSVWMGGQAVRYDPVTEQSEVYAGLNGPYTYSDMTGWALQNASCEPAG